MLLQFKDAVYKIRYTIDEMQAMTGLGNKVSMQDFAIIEEKVQITHGKKKALKEPIRIGILVFDMRLNLRRLLEPLERRLELALKLLEWRPPKPVELTKRQRGDGTIGWQACEHGLLADAGALLECVDRLAVERDVQLALEHDVQPVAHLVCQGEVAGRCGERRRAETQRDAQRDAERRRRGAFPTRESAFSRRDELDELPFLHKNLMNDGSASLTLRSALTACASVTSGPAPASETMRMPSSTTVRSFR